MTGQVEPYPEAGFETRTSCITCGSERLRELSSGRFADDPLHGFMAADPFGEDPLPYLRNATWSFVQCADCGQKFHRNILNEEWLGIYYNRWISSEAIERFLEARSESVFQREFNVGKHAIERILLLEKLTRELRGTDPVRVLDFGCGEGTFLAACACCGFEGVGIEFSAAREARKRVAFFPDLEQVAATYEPGHFHAITLFEVLEHLTHPRDVLIALRPLVRPGGILMLETPNCDSVTGIETRADYALIGPLGHINAFDPVTQERIANETGFTRISPGVVQCTADMARVYKREARRFLRPFLKRYTRQVFVRTA